MLNFSNVNYKVTLSTIAKDGTVDVIKAMFGDSEFASRKAQDYEAMKILEEMADRINKAPKKHFYIFEVEIRAEKKQTAKEILLYARGINTAHHILLRDTQGVYPKTPWDFTNKKGRTSCRRILETLDILCGQYGMN